MIETLNRSRKAATHATSGFALATVSSIALMAGVAPGTFAQSAADSAPLEEIIVPGIRRGISDSINVKRNELSLVEVVSAEDIGKLPDVSIAESIARLPGLAAQRVGGRAQVISIRGFSPDFTTTYLNGRPQASSGDNRAVEFDQYPSELLSSVVVYKSPDAMRPGMGLSGTIDMRTVRPLEYGKQAIVLNARGEFIGGDKLNSDVRNWGGRASISYIDQFADGTIGIAIGFAHLDSPSQNKHYKAYGYEGFAPTNRVFPVANANALLLNGQEVFSYSRTNQRDAALGTVEWKPSDSIHTTLDLYYSSFRQRETMRGMQWFSNAWADDATFTNVAVQDRGGSPLGVTGSISKITPQLRNDFNKRDDSLFAAGLNNEFNAGDWTLTLDLGYSRNHRKEQILETYAGYGLGVGGVTGGTQNVGRTFDNFTFDISNAGDGYPTYSAGLDYADASRVSLGDRAPWGGWGHDGAIRFPDVTEKVYTADAKAHYDMESKALENFIDGIDFGVNYTRREKSKTVDDNDLFLNGANRQQILVDSQYLVDPTSLSYAGLGSVLSVDLEKALDAYYRRAPIRDSNYYDKAWKIKEDVLTFSTRATIDIDMGDTKLRGNIGMQVVHQKQESSGVIIQGTPITPLSVTRSTKYTNFLPNINLNWDMGGGHNIRFAASRILQRPRMDDLRANITPSFAGPGGSPLAPGTEVHPWSGRGGNPLLKPWKATGIDLAYEWYFGKASYLSVAGFYKHLDTYIYLQTLPFDFTGVPIPTTGPQYPSNVVISPIGQMSLPANGKGGSVQGFEVSGALELSKITPTLDGFGITGSYAYTKSDLNTTSNPNPLQAVRIAGLSKHVYNLTGYFEKNGFQARISKRYRSSFKGEVVQLFATRGFTEILPDRQVDAQIGYTFQEGSALEGLGVTLQAFNLTDDPYITRLGTDLGGTKTVDGSFLPETYEKYGRTFLFGITYKF